MKSYYKKLEKAMAYYADIIVDQNGRTKCELCNVFIRDSDIFIEDHLTDMEHEKKYEQRLMIQNNISVNHDQIICDLCNQVADIPKLLNHIDSATHKNKMSSLKEIIEKDGGLLVLPESLSNVRAQINCLVCDRWVDFTYEATKAHITSARHKRARAIAVQPLNAIFSVEDNTEDLWCKICQVYFQNYIEIILEHVDDDPVHAKKLGKILLLIKDQNINIEKFLYDPKEDKAFCKKCKIEVPCNVDNLERHIKGKKHTTS